MRRDELTDLSLFAMIAEERSFSRGATRIGMTPSAASHAIRGLEERLGVRLLSRSTRAVIPTEAGEQLLRALDPALIAIREGLEHLARGRGRPAGIVRITAVKHAIETVLMPILPSFRADYPDVRLEIDVDDGMVDIVARGYDAGIRFAGSVARGMTAVPVGGPIETRLVACPGYLAGRSAPTATAELFDHMCIGHRRIERPGLYPWSFIENGSRSALTIDSSLAFNDSHLILDAVLAGLGIAYLFRDAVEHHLVAGRLVRVLAGFEVGLEGYSLYYANGRQTAPALECLINTLAQWSDDAV